MGGLLSEFTDGGGSGESTVVEEIEESTGWDLSEAGGSTDGSRWTGPDGTVPDQQDYIAAVSPFHSSEDEGAAAWTLLSDEARSGDLSVSELVDAARPGGGSDSPDLVENNPLDDAADEADDAAEDATPEVPNIPNPLDALGDAATAIILILALLLAVRLSGGSE